MKTLKMNTLLLASVLAVAAFAPAANAGQQVGEISELNNCIIIQVLGPNQYLTNCVPPAGGGWRKFVSTGHDYCPPKGPHDTKRS